MFRRKHKHSTDCAECCSYANNQYTNGYESGCTNTRLRTIELKELYENNKAELTKARIKIDVYERMFSALRIPVLPREVL